MERVLSHQLPTSPSQAPFHKATDDHQTQGEQMIRPGPHRQRQDIVSEHNTRRRPLPLDRRRDRAASAGDFVAQFARRAPADRVRGRAATSSMVHHRHGGAVLSIISLLLLHSEPRRRRLLAVVRFGVPASLPPPEQPKAALSLDPDEGLAGAVHEEHLAAAAAAVVVDAEGHAAVGAVHGAAVAVEHQRLHPHRVLCLLLQALPIP